jgi:hypothetical protein
MVVPDNLDALCPLAALVQLHMLHEEEATFHPLEGNLPF